jgi:hypothetical protein
MISHRSRGINKAQPTTASSVRQTLSAQRVILILSKECPSNLPPLPVIPYAVSLSMSVAYRAFRQTKVLTHKERAREELKTCCELLEEMKTAWWSAGAMAELGRAALKKAAIGRGTKKKDKAPVAVPPTPTTPDMPRQTLANQPSRSPIDDVAQDPTSLAQIQGSLPATAEGFDPNVPAFPMDPAPPFLGFHFSDHSPDWLNFDNAFENFDMLLGSSGADLSMEMLRPFGDGGFGYDTGS